MNSTTYLKQHYLTLNTGASLQLAPPLLIPGSLGPDWPARGILIPAPCSADCVVVLLFAASLGRIFADMHLLSESCKRIYVCEIYISLTQTNTALKRMQYLCIDTSAIYLKTQFFLNITNVISWFNHEFNLA